MEKHEAAVTAAEIAPLSSLVDEMERGRVTQDAVEMVSHRND
jgi:hypothetical protein